MSTPKLMCSPTTWRLLHGMAHGQARTDDAGLDFAIWYLKRTHGIVTFKDGSVVRWDRA